MSETSNLLPAFTPAQLTSWTAGTWEGAPVTVQGVSNQGRTMPAGALYVALAGERLDGHDFVGQAAAHGAAAALVRRDWRGGAQRPDGSALPLLRVDDTRAALRAAAAGYRRTWPGLVAGVTGSVGKTTTKELIAAFFRAGGSTAATAGNFNNEIGLPLSLLATQPGTARGIFELGTNHPGEIGMLARVLRPDAATVTAIGPVHIEHFGTVEAIADEKAELLRAVPSQGFVTLDADSPLFDYLRRQVAARVVSVSLERPDTDYAGRVLDVATGLCEVRERSSGRMLRLQTGLAGRHHGSNLLLAVAMACGAGVPWEALEGALAQLRMPPMRWQKASGRGLTVINDAYNANPVAMVAALQTLAQLTDPGRRVVVLGDMLELGAAEESLHREVGRAAAQGPWEALICVGARARWIADACVCAGYPARQVWRYDDAAAAAADRDSWSRPGDLVLLKASRGIGLERVAEALLGCATGEPHGMVGNRDGNKTHTV
jgi:UDP-N-acetylmuramoyl-tripeptide--D-alanyl-D-alanine ligase